MTDDIHVDSWTESVTRGTPRTDSGRGWNRYVFTVIHARGGRPVALTKCRACDAQHERRQHELTACVEAVWDVAGGIPVSRACGSAPASPPESPQKTQSDQAAAEQDE
jgi:hypothetical protein